MQNKILSCISLATKAGRTASGELSIEKCVKSGKASLVILAEDASDRTKKNYTNMCDFYKVPLRQYGTMEELGHFIGKEFRAAIAVTDMHFSETLMRQMDEIM